MLTPQQQDSTVAYSLFILYLLGVTADETWGKYPSRYYKFSQQSFFALILALSGQFSKLVAAVAAVVASVGYFVFLKSTPQDLESCLIHIVNLAAVTYLICQIASFSSERERETPTWVLQCFGAFLLLTALSHVLYENTFQKPLYPFTYEQYQYLIGGGTILLATTFAISTQCCA